jgi:hypothetical protein
LVLVVQGLHLPLIFVAVKVSLGHQVLLAPTLPQEAGVAVVLFIHTTQQAAHLLPLRTVDQVVVVVPMVLAVAAHQPSETTEVHQQVFAVVVEAVLEQQAVTELQM